MRGLPLLCLSICSTLVELSRTFSIRFLRTLSLFLRYAHPQMFGTRGIRLLQNLGFLFPENNVPCYSDQFGSSSFRGLFVNQNRREPASYRRRSRYN